MITRRCFLASAACAAPLLSVAGRSVFPASVTVEKGGTVEARYYEKLPNRKIRCNLCPRSCVIDDLERGYCGVRENRGGTYYTLVYGHPCSIHVDPIEKKPLFHFLPASRALSLGTAGCNVFCKFCQNWEISQSRPEQLEAMEIPPERMVEMARRENCPAIACTYNEPVVFAEYMHDIALSARRQGIRTVMISNGYIQKKPMLDLCRSLSAVKIDLKAFSERFYKELVSGELRPVLDTLVLLRGEQIWFEIVYLVIPGENDSRTELTSLCRWIAAELGMDVPIHFTRFYPQYRMTNLPPTPVKSLQEARKIGLEAGLNFVYTGNLPGDEGENTLCPTCHALLIRRLGYTVVENRIKSSHCPECKTTIPGVWK